MKRYKSSLSYKRAHPYTIFTILQRFIFLFILPVIQQLLFRPANIVETISTMGLNILFVIFLFAFAIREYKYTMYRYTDNFVYIKKGRFIRRIMKIPHSKIQMVSIEKTISSKFFGASKFYIDTPGGGKRNVDIGINISNKDIGNFIETIMPKKHTARVYKCSIIRMLLMSASWANPGVGLLILSPFVQQAGEILGEEFSRLFYNSVNITYRLAAIGISPVAAVLANVLIIGWAVAMLVQTIRYANFSVYKYKNIMMIKRGFIIRNTRIIFKDRITAVTVKQTITMKLFKLHSAYVRTIGSGKEKSDKSLLVAAARRKQMRSIINRLVYLHDRQTETIKPPNKRFFSYIFVPFSITILSIGGLIYLYIKNINRELIIIALLFTFISMIWWIIFRLFAFKSSFMSYNDNVAIISTFEKFTLCKNYIPYNKIQYIEIRQNLFQRKSKCCDVYIWIFSDKKEKFKIKYLDKSQADKMLDIIQRKIDKTLYN